jgi:Na+-transporting NADH:ubiquinone oxidoreductase subunit NqrC
MRALSPIIAVMFLIGITLAISYIVGNWVVGFAMQERTESEYCRAEKIQVRSGVYDRNESKLLLVIENYGKKDVEAVVFLHYFNRTLHPNITDVYPQRFFIEKKTLKTIGLNSIEDDLASAIVQSVNCKGAQSMVRDVDIRGLKHKA